MLRGGKPHTYVASSSVHLFRHLEYQNTKSIDGWKRSEMCFFLQEVLTAANDSAALKVGRKPPSSVSGCHEYDLPH